MSLILPIVHGGGGHFHDCRGEGDVPLSEHGMILQTSVLASGIYTLSKRPTKSLYTVYRRV